MTIQEIPKASKWKIVSSSIVLDPKFAIKELIDNAIDAGAKNVYVDMDSKTSGCDYICVRDDGTGIDKEDRSLLCLNHATSKIGSFSDLSCLASLGFRGEALFSLATLANQKGSMEIATRCSDEQVGEKWCVDKDGAIKKNTKKKVPCPRGTTITIRNLLAGLRARYLEASSKALKNKEEINHIINHYSLNFRSIRFHFSLVRTEKNGQVGQKQLQESLDTNISKVRALSVIGRLRKPTLDNFLVIDGLMVTHLIQLYAILPRMHPESDVVNLKRAKKFLSVNGRPMSLQLNLGVSINKILNGIYRQLRLLDPISWYIDIICDPKILDLNIEPGKDDIMIKGMNYVMEKISETLSLCVSKELGGDEKIHIDGNKANATDGCAEANKDIIDLSEEEHEDLSLNALSQMAQGASKNTSVIETINRPVRRRSLSSFADEQKSSNRDPIYCGPTPDGDQRKHSLLSEEEADTGQLTKASANLPSSLTYSYEKSPSVDGDLQLAMNPFVSNPSPTAELVKHHKAIHSPDSHPIAYVPTSKKRDSEQVIQAANDDEFTINGRIKIRKLTECEEQSLQSLGNSKAAEKRPQLLDEMVEDEPTTLRKIGMFSEYTNSHTILMSYNENQKELGNYKEELKWLARDHDPSERLTSSLNNYSDAMRNRKISLAKAREGWFILTA